jgi:hypothetical protein
MNKCSRWLAAVGFAMLTVATARAQGGMPMHGNHNPHHGGIVLMYGMDLHFEVVLERTGALRIYFSDGQRVDLPASSVSDLAVEIERPGAMSEAVAMTIDATGDYWQGKSAPVGKGDSTMNIAFVFRGDPILVSVPTSNVLSEAQRARERVLRHA